MAGSEVEHGVGDLADDGEHGLLQFGLELRFARLEPFAVVVAGEAAQEGQGFGTEVGERCDDSGFWSARHM